MVSLGLICATALAEGFGHTRHLLFYGIYAVDVLVFRALLPPKTQTQDAKLMLTTRFLHFEPER